MTEAEWEASEDPGAMLRAAQGHTLRDAAGRLRRSDISDRKLRLFACACRRQVPDLGWTGQSQGWQDMEDHPEKETLANGYGPGTVPALGHAELFIGDGLSENFKPAPRVAAHLLRDITGNPFRPVSLPGERLRCDCGGSYQPIRRAKLPMSICSKCHADGPFYPDVLAGKPPAWFRCGQVRDLAHAAYDGERCEKCDGKGRIALTKTPHQRSITVAGITLLTMAAVEGWLDDIECYACRGAGYVYSGTLDPFRLSLVADALEDAGCDSESILKHLRSPGPHVRGCWVIDLLTGKE